MNNMLLFWFWALFNRGDYGLICTGATFGRYRVIYPDGMISRRMYYNTAADYAGRYGGDIEYIGKSERNA